MDNTPLGVSKLMQSSDVTLCREAYCCHAVYGVSSLQAGSLLRIKSTYKSTFIVRDLQDEQIATFQLKQRCFHPPYLTVRVSGAPELTVRPKAAISRSILVMDDQDQQILRIRHAVTSVWPKDELKITDRNNMEIGRIETDCREWHLHCPEDLQVQYKLALMAVCIFIELQISTSSD